MVRIRDLAWGLTVAAVIMSGPRAALADPINFTGNAASDFSVPGTATVAIDQGPGYIQGPTGSTAGQLVAGVDIQNILLNYNSSTDTLSVGIQGYQNVAGQEEIFGDASGNPNPSLDANPNFGGLKSFAIAFAPTSLNASGQEVAGTPTIIAGIPQNKATAGTGIDGFSVAQNTNNTAGLEFSFGTQIANSGNLAFNPSAAQPDAEFTINNFSKISGVGLTNGFYIEAYSGTPGSGDGKVQTQWIYVPPLEPQVLPEPTTWMVWAALAGGVAFRFRRSRRIRP
jgi:hypothetical protein